MAKPSKKKTPTEPITVSKIYETIQAKGYLGELWLELIFDIKQKPTYQRLQAMVNEVINNNMSALTARTVDERDERLKESGLTELSIMTYTLDTVISEVLYRRYQNELEVIVKNLIRDVLKSKAEEASTSAKNNSVSGSSQRILNKKTRSTENGHTVTDANKCQIGNSSKDGEETKAAPARKRGRPKKTSMNEGQAENRAALPERKEMSIPVTSDKNIASFNDEIKHEVHDEVSDAESEVSVGNMSLDSVSSVHTSELSSFEDDISICSDDEGEKKYVPLKVANEMYLQGKLSQIYQFGKNSERLKRMKEASASVSKDLNSERLKQMKEASAPVSKDLNSRRGKRVNKVVKNSTKINNSSCSQNGSFSARKVLPQRVRKPNPKYNSETMYCDAKDYSLPHADAVPSSSEDEMDNTSGPPKVQRKRRRSSLDKGTTCSPPKITSARNISALKGGKPINSPKLKVSTKSYDTSDLYKPRSVNGGIGSRSTAVTLFST